MPKKNYLVTNGNDSSQQLMNHTQAWQITTETLNAAENAGQKQQIMSGYLQGITGELNTRRMEAETLGSFADDFKDVYTREERKKQISKRGTQLWQKNKNAKALEKCESERRKKMQDRAVSAAKKTGYRINFSSPTLIALSSFMKNSTRNNATLLRNFISGERRMILQLCIHEFMSQDLERLDLKSDKKTAENAETLEKLSERFSGIQYLVSAYSDIYAMLPEELRISFEQYFGKANAVVTHYRLKKAVMTDQYYRTHENREIGVRSKTKTTAAQQNLSEMIWQSQGGLAIFLNKADDHIKNGTVRSLKAALQKSGVRKEKLSLQDRLRKRRKELEERGLAARMDDFIWRERHIDVKGNLGIVGHARNLQACSLTGNPDKDLAFLPELMDQCEVIEQVGVLREKSKSSYYLEQSDFQIVLADTAINMLACVKRMQEDLLTIGQLTQGGAIDTGLTQEKINLCKERYQQDLAEYKEKMTGLRNLRKSPYVLMPQESPENAEYKEKEEKSDPLKEAKDLIATLTTDRFSDYGIYLNRDRICALSKKCKDSEVSEVLDVLAARAVVLWKRKRLLNVRKALKEDKNNEDLKAEEQRLETDENDGTMDAMLKLRADAEKKGFDFQDLKAQARHYTNQFDWAVTSKGEGGGIINWAVGTLFDYINKKHRTDRELVHGEEKYEEAVQKLQMLPAQITEHQENTPILLQKGSEEVPVIDLTNYYEDRDKDALKARAAEIRAALQGHENDYPEEFQTALTAMEHYVKIKYIVTTDTTEMEMAFLDKFQKDMERALRKMKKVNFEDAVTRGLLDIMTEIYPLGRGKLRDKDNPNGITDAELAAAMEQPAIYTMNSEEDLRESNVKDIPLFTHKPNLNDIKQGYVGDCYFMSAVTAFMRSNPEGIMNMFYDAGDGNVLVRLYMGFDENNRRVDTEEDMKRPEVTLRPVYIKVRKDYDLNGVAHDCMWIQLLEKAYASTGAQHKSFQVDPETGELKRLVREISGGTSPKILMHLTGRKDCWEHDRPILEDSPVDENILDEYRMRSILSGVHSSLHYDIWDEIKKITHKPGEGPDDWEKQVLAIVRKYITQMNEIRRIQLEERKNNILTGLKNVSPEQLNELEKKIFELYIPDVETVVERVRQNLYSDAPDVGDGTDLIDPSSIIDGLYDFFKEGMSPQEILSQFNRREVRYEPVNYTGNEEAIQSVKKMLPAYAAKCNKAMMEYNPDGRYSTGEMIFLHDEKKKKKRGEGMHFAVFGHEMAILDTELKNGHWYLLVRDTNNIRQYTYEKDEQGDLKGTPGENSFAIKDGIRRLDGDLNTNVRGTSWWELKTIYDKMYSYGNAPKVS